MKSLFKLIASKAKLIALILFVILFLIATQSLLAQNTSGTTSLSGKQLKALKLTNKAPDTICIRASLADTIIHDLEERRLLLIQNQALYSYKDVLTNELYEKEEQIKKISSDVNKYKTKSVVRGWQRNGLIAIVLMMGIVLL